MRARYSNKVARAVKTGPPSHIIRIIRSSATGRSAKSGGGRRFSPGWRPPRTARRASDGGMAMASIGGRPSGRTVAIDPPGAGRDAGRRARLPPRIRPGRPPGPLEHGAVPGIMMTEGLVSAALLPVASGLRGERGRARGEPRRPVRRHPALSPRFFRDGRRRDCEGARLIRMTLSSRYRHRDSLRRPIPPTGGHPAIDPRPSGRPAAGPADRPSHRPADRRGATGLHLEGA